MLNDRFESLGKIVYYPHGAGGKFIMNSLGLSRHSVLHDVNFALWDLKQTAYDAKYYNQKLEWVLTTVPDTTNDHGWQHYEFGVPPGAWLDSNCQYIVPILNDNTKAFFVIAHSPEITERFLTKYPGMQVIKLTNYTNWMDYSKFKVGDLEKDIENKMAYWGYIDRKEVESNKYNPILIDMDNNITDEVKMQQAISGLYDQLGFDDFQPELWLQYYRKYIKAHTL